MTSKRILVALMVGTLMVGAPAASPARAGAPLTILAGDTAGVYYPLGIAIAKILSDALPERTVQVQVSKGSVANLKALADGKGEIAMATADAIEAARRGDASSGFDRPLTELRGLAALYPNLVQIVATAKSGIRQLSDLKGKRISIGAAQSGTELNARDILAAAGLDAREIGAVKESRFSEAITQMKDDKIDVTIQSAGVGVSSLNELSNTLDIVMVAVPREVVTKLGAPFAPATIPANTYRGQNDAVPTAEVMTYLVIRADVPDARTAQLADLLIDHLDELKIAHAATRNMSLRVLATNGPMPMHPGAHRVFAARLKRADADDLNARGEKRLAKGEKTAALSDFMAALKLDPEHQAARDNQKKLARIIERDGAMMGIGGPPK